MNNPPLGMLAIDQIGMEFALADDERTINVLDNVSLDIPKGRFVSIVGHSGCGKSTLLRIMAGLTQPTLGEVRVDGNVVDGPHASRGMVFQQDAVFPWLSVRDNIEYGLKVRGVKKAQRKIESDAWIKLVGLDGWENAYPRQLSGGMRKRVDLARVYANKPDVMLMDEPFGALDAQTKATMQSELLSLWQQAGSTVVFVTHDLEEAIFLSDMVIVLSRNPGRIKQVQHVELPRPRTEKLRMSDEFLGEKRRLFDVLSET
ncbi:ABC transporter ATP-binding protein [Granulosicoccus sp. 3-233]|uniref:ABC transporter ATP-binding protein n=1 Tax=Granulosicoccus sp. 3-233 TaxID=3417969 RepID=UPI003D3416E6